MTGTSEDIRWPLENQRNSGNSFMTAPEAMVQTCSARPALNTLVEDKRSAADDSDGQIETVYGNAAAAEEPQTTRVSYMPATSPSAVQTQAKTTQQLQQTSSTLTPGPLSSQKPRTHTAAASYSAFPNLPILPSEGLMSGPYPSLRPVSVHEPLQPLPAAVPPASLFPQSNASALDARPSLSAPFPPTGPTAAAISMQHRLSKGSLREPRASPSPQPNRSPQLVGNTGTYFAPQPEASTSRAALNAIPIRRPEPEVCVECMMRDRDMADVIVTGSGIWSRASDVDFEEALAAEDEEDRLAAAADNSTTDHSKQGGAKSSTHHGNGSLVNIQAGTSFDSEESGYAASASAGSVERFRSFKSTHSRKKRIGRGNPLLATSLQEWNSYMTPVSNFRWKSLKAYLQDQAALIRPEDVIAAARHQHQRRSRHQQRSYPDVRENKTDNPPARRRVQSSSAGPAAEPPRTRAAKPKDQHLVSSSSSPDMAQLLQEELDGQVVAKASPYLSAGFAASNASMPLAVPSLQMPPRRFSTPMPDQPVSSSITSSSKLTEPVMVTSHDPYDVPISRSFMGPRPSSPSAYSERPRSVWSSFNRLRRSNGSAFSLAPSGASMMDMHVGLSIDRHYPRSPGARYEAAQHIDQMEKAKAAHETENVANDTRRKKKGIRKLISRFFDGGSSTNRKEKSSGSDHHGKAAAPSMLDLSYLSSTGDPNEPLKPPDRRFLGGVRGARRDRSSSSSSLSSFPHSPKEGSADVTFRRPSSVYFDQPSSPADSYHILATTSPATDLAPARGMVSASLQSEKSLPTVLQDKGPSPTLRREKSLPALPDEHFHIAGDHKLRVSSPICIQEPVELHGSHPSSRTDNYSFDASRSFVDVDDGDSIGGGRRSKARTKIFGMPFRKRKDVRDSDVFPSMPSKSEVLAVSYSPEYS